MRACSSFVPEGVRAQPESPAIASEQIIKTVEPRCERVAASAFAAGRLPARCAPAVRSMDMMQTPSCGGSGLGSKQQMLGNGPESRDGGNLSAQCG